MLRRLAVIAIACTLAACTADSYDPTGVTFSRGIDDERTTLPPGLCDGAAASDYAIIPPCVDEASWPGNLFDVRARHEYETVKVRAGLGGSLKDKGRLF